MPLDIIGAAVAQTAVERAAREIEAWCRNSTNHVLSVDTRDSGAAIRDHYQMVASWSTELGFRSVLRSQTLRDTFIQQDLRLGTGSYVARGRDMTLVAPTELPNHDHHSIILGPPGAGKTTALQKLAATALGTRDEEKHRVPIVVRLRDLTPDESLCERLLAIAGVHVRVRPEQANNQQLAWRRRGLTTFLDSLKALVLLDGLDETAQSIRSAVERELRDLAEHTRRARFVLTCRSGSQRHIPGFQEYSLVGLRQDDVEQLARRWLGPEGAAAFLQELVDSPLLGVEVLPLALAQLCAVYERLGKLPHQPNELYEKLLRLLLSEWDEHRGIVRGSTYADFGPGKKLRFLGALSFDMTARGVRGTFTSRQLEIAYAAVRGDFALPADEGHAVVGEIESHTGLIVRDGQAHSFLHRTFQEFLAASHIAGSRSPFGYPTVPEMPEELAVATALSSQPELFFLELMRSVGRPRMWGTHRLRDVFLASFAQRFAIERADLRPSSTVGWCLLVLLRATSAVHGNDATQSQQFAQRLATSPGCAVSVRYALQRARHAQITSGMVRLHPDDDPDLSHNLRALVEGSGGIVLSHSILAGLRWDATTWTSSDANGPSAGIS